MRYVHERDALEMFHDFLEEIFGLAQIAGSEYSTGYTLIEVDPTNYWGQFNEWADRNNITTTESEATE